MKNAIFFAFLILISCGVTTVVHDYDEQQDFSVYKSYNFFPEMETGLNALDTKRLLKVADSILQVQGFVKSNTPDVYINFKTKTRKEASNSNLGVGVGSGNGGVNIGLGGAIPIGGPVTLMEVVTDLVDVKKDELVWQAAAEKRFYAKSSPEERILFFQKVLQKSFNKYPPSKKK